MIKKFLTLALTLTLGLSSCTSDDVTPVLPKSGIKIDKGVLSAYPEKEIMPSELVSLPEVTEIADKVFEGYKTLRTLKAPKLTKIGAAAFKGSSLKSLHLGATVPTVGEGAFDGTSEEKDLVVPAEKVADFMDFAKKYQFMTINGTPLPGTQIEIENGVLLNYPIDKTPADGVVKLEASVKEIADKVFEGNTRLKEIHAPGIKKIGAAAFKGCIGLVKVDFGGAQRPPLAIDETDKDFGTAEDAFWNTPEDKVLVFNEANNPNFLQYFEYIARHHFAKLDGIKIPAELDSKAFNVKDGVLKGIKNQYYLAGQGKNGVLVLPSSIKRIEGGVFGDKFQNFKAIYAEGVEEIGNYAFNATASLNYAHLPKLKRVGEGCFLDNASLDAVNFPKLEEIGHICFNGGSNISGNGLKITYISLPAVKKIGRGAFHGNYKNSGVAVLLGAMPEVDFNPYSDDDPFHDGHVAFGQMKDPVLYVTPANKETYQITDGKWKNFTVKDLK
ncbi:leucine-rich repeat domain-containing protein [uncultured Porphyromonas sp.]|uniref:leucine-rich repeat domain-containing protein n=1 Tax=uncultured Porphyromonas sp. TaxID=159274 RepID=UPI00261733D1|nr:leucine-rich repeat domain-containing protein [uncultured Porphyromonas sp.]